MSNTNKTTPAGQDVNTTAPAAEKPETKPETAAAKKADATAESAKPETAAKKAGSRSENPKPEKAADKPGAATESGKGETPGKETKEPAQQGDFRKKYWEPFLRPMVTLVVICIVTSLLLSITNSITGPIIERNEAAAADAARRELLPEAGDAGFVQLALKDDAPNIISVYKAVNDTGYIIEAYGIGYGGRVPVMVAFNANNNIAGVKFLSNDETPGLGQKLVTDKSFSAQFAGRTNERVLPGDIDGIASSTISTGAALTGINAAIAYYNTHILGIDEGAGTPEEIRAALLPGATSITELPVSGDNIASAWQGDDGNFIVYATARGYESTVTAAVAINGGDGSILGLWLDTSGDTAGFGREVDANTDFISQFTGRTSSDGVDIVSGATVTSRAVMEAVDTALAYFAANLSGTGGPAPTPAPTPEGIRASLLPGASSIQPIELTAEGVQEAYMGDDGNFIVYAAARGYESEVVAAVAIDGASGAVLALWLDTSGETAGFGRDVAADKDYLARFAGETDADGVDGVAGATATSNAVARAVNLALDAFAGQLQGTVGPGGVLLASLLPGAETFTGLDVDAEGVTAAFAGDDGNFIIFATAQGYDSTVTAAVAIDGEAGTVLGLWLNTSGETPGFGRDLAGNEDYLDAFNGLDDAGDADTVSGATITSRAVAKAVNAALGALQQAKEAI